MRADGLSKDDKLALAQLLDHRTLGWVGKLNVDRTVSELLERYQQTPCLIDLMAPCMHGEYFA